MYKITRLGWGIDGFSKLDLLELRDKLTKAAPVLNHPISSELISMKQIFAKNLVDNIFH